MPWLELPMEELVELPRKRGTGKPVMLHKQTDGCLVCVSHRPSKTTGYVHIAVDGRLMLAHRYAYQVRHGHLSPDLHIHHECENRRCCNADHLTPMTKSQHQSLTNALTKQRIAAGTHRPWRPPAEPVIFSDRRSAALHVLRTKGRATARECEKAFAPRSRDAGPMSSLLGTLVKRGLVRIAEKHMRPDGPDHCRERFVYEIAEKQ